MMCAPSYPRVAANIHCVAAWLLPTHRGVSLQFIKKLTQTRQDNRQRLLAAVGYISSSQFERQVYLF